MDFEITDDLPRVGDRAFHQRRGGIRFDWGGHVVTFAYSGAVPPVFFEARFPCQPPANPNSPAHSNCVVAGPPPFLLPAHAPLPPPYIQPKY